MRGFILFFFLFSFFQISSTAGWQNCATVTTNYNLFFLCPFASIQPYNITDDSLDVIFTIGNNHLISCENQLDVWADIYLDYLNPVTCYSIATQSPKYSLINQSASNDGLVITFPSVTKNQTVYQLVINLLCDDETATTNGTQFNITNIDNGVIQVTGTSQYGCPYISLTSFFNVLTVDEGIGAFLSAIIGLILLSQGIKLISLFIFVIVSLLIAILTITGVFDFTTSEKVWPVWVIIGFSVVVGFIIAKYQQKHKITSHFYVGVITGVFLASIFFNTVIYKIQNWQLVYNIATFAAFALIAGGVTAYIFEDFIVLATSIFGSYFILRVFNIYLDRIGGFPTTIFLLRSFTQYNFATYCYLAGFFLLILVGTSYQYKNGFKRSQQVQNQI